MLTFFRTRLRHLQNCLHELVISGSWPGELRPCGVSLKWLIRGGSVARRSLCRRLLRLRRLIWRSLLRSIGRRRWRFCFRRRGIRKLAEIIDRVDRDVGRSSCRRQGRARGRLLRPSPPHCLARRPHHHDFTMFLAATWAYTLCSSSSGAAEGHWRGRWPSDCGWAAVGRRVDERQSGEWTQKTRNRGAR